MHIRPAAHAGRVDRNVAARGALIARTNNRLLLGCGIVPFAQDDPNIFFELASHCVSIQRGVRSDDSYSVTVGITLPYVQQSNHTSPAIAIALVSR
jgi:hypothetical protein